MNPYVAINLTINAYDDYIASRFLLNNGYNMQGAILASTAIEKYLKAMLVCIGVDLNKIKVHLDKFEKLKSYFDNTEYADLFTNHFDRAFFEIVSKVYLF